MKSPIIRLLTGSLLVVLAAWLISAAPRSAEEPMRWYTIEEVIEIKEANPDDDKAVFIDVYTDWCGWCKRMDATTFKNKDVQAILSDKYYAVKFDGEQRETITMQGQEFKYVASGRRGYHELAAALLQNKLSYPTVVFLDEDMNMIQPLPGYRGAKEMLPILHFIGEKAYQNQTWDAFSADWQKENGR